MARAAVSPGVPPRPTAGLLAALIVGDQNAIDRADWDIFRATGVAHLVDDGRAFLMNLPQLTAV